MTTATTAADARCLQATVPATLVTGFLGSGKTTLLNRLLRRPEMRGCVVVVNEFGEIGLDHLLIEQALEDAVLLKSGCICCSVRGDLVDTLVSLAARRSTGEMQPFRRVLIESSGLADPAPILQTLISAPELAGRYRLERVIATVDAANAESQLAAHYESAKQAALADRLVLTKSDLVAPATVARVVSRLASLNPRAPILTALQGEIAPQHLFAGEEASGAYALSAQDLSAQGHDHAEHTGAHAAHHGIESFVLTHGAPIAWETLSAWLASIASLRGADFLRLKGIVNVAGRAGPVAIDGVQHVFHPPRELARWPDEDRRTRIVFIVRNIPRGAVEASFAAAIGAAR
jgi:G3E family GTPase